jgi:uncharacterized protein (TIGR02266 family)
MGDRRDFPRITLAMDVEYMAESSVIGRSATLENLSVGGAALVTEEKLHPGDRLRYLHFTLESELGSSSYRPTAEVVRAEARTGIGRRHEYLVAVTFVDLADEDQERISTWILDRFSKNAMLNPRVQLERQVAVRFQRFDEFVTVVSKNLSQTGMFIQTEEPRPSGSQFEFVLQLGEDFNLVQGQAEVVWSRRTSEGPDRPAGMGIKFVSLDKTSEGVLLRLIEKHVEPSYPRKLGSAPPEPSVAGDELLDTPDLDDFSMS